MGFLSGVWNTNPTVYDELDYNEYTTINRLTNFHAWALLNQRYQSTNWLAPDGILYCSIHCAIIDNPAENWLPDDMEAIVGHDYWALRHTYGHNPWRKDICPHCGLSYHESLAAGQSPKLGKRKRVVAYIVNRLSWDSYPAPAYSIEKE